MSRETQLWIWLIFGTLIVGLFYLLAPVLTPFVVSAALAYLADPIVKRIDARQPKLSRTWAVITAFAILFVVFLLALFFVVPTVVAQITKLVHDLPKYIGWLQVTIIPWLRTTLEIDPSLFNLIDLQSYLIDYLDEIRGLISSVLGSLSKSSVALVGWLANLILIPVVTFYLVRDWQILMANIQDLLPRRIEPIIVKLMQEVDEVLGAFLLGQFIVMLALGAIYSLGLLIIGLELALLIGMLAGLVSFVPYLGFIVGILVAGIAAIFQFQDAFYLVPVVIVFAIAQLIEGMVLTPLLVGDRIGLHPVAVIFAVMAGGHLFGFIGVLLALPIAAVIMVLLRHTHDEYLKSALYGD
jgi:predicted PurR-regulated permease PerM